MPQTKLRAAFALCLALASLASAALAAIPAPLAIIADLDLAKPFAARSPWRLIASQGPSVDDPIGLNGQIPGAIQLCLRREQGAACDPALASKLPGAASDDLYASAHYLDRAEIVYPRATGEPLLLVQASSIHSGDGDQLRMTQVLAYRSQGDRFERVYDHQTGANNNQEVRFIASGPLRGDIISSEPTQNAPYGFWITVNTLAPGQAYKQALRYRSATHYGDGNPLAVIDSEMANIEQRLGLWKPGLPLPLPAGACAKPHLVKMELWCS